MAKAPPQQDVAALLDVYEDAVRHTSSLGRSRFDWQGELRQINLQRYVLRTAAGQNDLAEQALMAAATIKKNGEAPTQAEIEFYRQLANRLYPGQP